MMLAGLVIAGTLAPAFGIAAGPTCLRGVNVAGAEFGDLPGRYGFDYAYPAEQTIKSLAAMGHTAIRLPLRWERLQPGLAKPLDRDELARLDTTIAAARTAGLITILDLHNYAYFNKARIGSDAVPVSAFADVWRRLASHLRRERSVAFGLMNEPYDLPAKDWLAAANAAIAGIRAAGAGQLILVSGTAYSGAHSWTSDLPVGNNGTTMLGVSDPANNYAFELHQYLDGDYSGRSAACENGSAALAAIERVGAWLTAHDKRGFLGEIGASNRPECVAALEKILNTVNADRRHWLGWTVWAAGDRWPADYPFNVQPTEATPPVLAMLARKVDPATCR
jgi:endoglucanase